MSTLEREHLDATSQTARELWCGGCGYGVVVRREPPECPMCRGSCWHERPTSARCN
jgi:hypothetical protein